MKLIPKARPVRIRISVGGFEHREVSTLKSKFCIKDIRDLLDGRLQRWLIQQGLGHVSDALPQDVNSLDDLVKVYGLLCDEAAASSHDFLWALLNDFRKNNIGEYEYLLNLTWRKNWVSNESLYEYLLRKASIKMPIPIENQIILDFLHFKMDWQGLYEYGLMLKEVHNSRKGMLYIQEAAKQGDKIAMMYIVEHEPKPQIKLRNRWGISDRERDIIKKYIKAYWENGVPFPSDKTELEQDIYQLVSTCKTICKTIQNSSINANNRNNLICKLIRYYNSPTYYDRETVNAIMHNTEVKLRDILDNYSPARALLPHNSSLPKINGKEFWQLSGDQQIEYIVYHLFDF